MLVMSINALQRWKAIYLPFCRYFLHHFLLSAPVIYSHSSSLRPADGISPSLCFLCPVSHTPVSPIRLPNAQDNTFRSFSYSFSTPLFSSTFYKPYSSAYYSLVFPALHPSAGLFRMRAIYTRCELFCRFLPSCESGSQRLAESAFWEPPGFSRLPGGSRRMPGGAFFHFFSVLSSQWLSSRFGELILLIHTPYLRGTGHILMIPVSTPWLALFREFAWHVMTGAGFEPGTS